MAQRKIKTIIWSEMAASQFYEILNYLSLRSPLAAEIVGEAILESISDLSSRYNQFPKDHLKTENDGSFRAFIIYSYRISYQIGESSVSILRVRHTSREPLPH